MREPRFTASFGTYRCEWDAPEHIVLDLDHLHSDARKSELTAEVTVRSTLSGFVGHIHQARLNLVSTVSRKAFAKHLAERTQGRDLDWEGMVEVAAIRTLRAFREGEPAIYMRDAIEPKDAGIIIDPLVIGRLPTVWFGDGGTGKSLLALAAGVALHLGVSVFGIDVRAERRVAYLDWEMGDWEHRQRLHGLCGDDMPDLLYVRCRGAIWDEVERLRRIIRDNSVGHVVIDSVGMACAGVPIETSEAALRFYDAVRALEIGALCIAHKTKDGSDEHPFGSIFWSNGARLIWLMRKQDDESGRGFKVGFYPRKANLGPKDRPLAYSIEFGERISIERTAVEGELAVEGASVRTRILVALKDQFRTTKQLAELLGAREDQIRVRLAEMLRRKEVTQNDDGLWGRLLDA